MGEWSFGQLMGQNSKVVHWPARLSETVELQLIIQVVIRETTMLSTCSSDSTPFFRCFDLYPGSYAFSLTVDMNSTIGSEQFYMISQRIIWPKLIMAQNQRTCVRAI